MPIRPHRHALGEARAVVAALSPRARGVSPGGGLPLPSDYWHVSNANYTASAVLPQETVTGTSGGTHSLSTASLSVVPFFVGRLGRTVTRLGIRNVVNPLAGSILKIGIYDCPPPTDYNVYPQTLVASVEVALAVTTGVQTGALASPVDLPNGLYWIAASMRSGNSTIRRVNSTGFNLIAGRSPLQWTNSVQNTQLSVALAAGTALPATFPAGATIVTGLPYFEVL